MDTIGRNIIIIEKHLKLFFKNRLSKYGLNAAEGIVLLLLFEKEMKPNENTLDSIHQDVLGKTQDEMIDEIHFDKSVMTRTMQTLESKGYVIRSVNKNDSRSYIFTLSQKAKEFKETLYDILRQYNESMLKGIPAENIEIMQKTLSQMAANITELLS